MLQILSPLWTRASVSRRLLVGGATAKSRPGPERRRRDRRQRVDHVGRRRQKAMQQPAMNSARRDWCSPIYEARRNAIDELTAGKLIDMEAKARGVETAALIDKEITSKIQPVTDADVSAWYDANRRVCRAPRSIRCVRRSESPDAAADGGRLPGVRRAAEAQDGRAADARAARVRKSRRRTARRRVQRARRSS